MFLPVQVELQDVGGKGRETAQEAYGQTGFQPKGCGQALVKIAKEHPHQEAAQNVDQERPSHIGCQGRTLSPLA